MTASAAVAFSGVIGFIGLIIPHLIRILWGPDYRHLIPLSILGGAGGLLLADMLARYTVRINDNNRVEIDLKDE